MRGSSGNGHLTFARWLVLCVLTAAIFGLMFTAVGSGRADIIAPLSGHLIGFGLAASLALLARRGMLVVLVAGMAATVGVHALLGLARCCDISTAREPARPQTTVMPWRQNLSILTLNTWHGHGDPERLGRYLATAPADVIVLSEFGPNKRPLLDRLRTIYPYQVDCAAASFCSLAMLSRIPMQASGTIRIGASKPAFVWAKVGDRRDPAVTIIGTQLCLPGSDPRRHATQMSELAQLIRSIEGPLLVAGDLNTSPWSYSFRLLRTLTGLAPTSVLLPSWPAWPVALPQVALDHILASSELAVTAAGTGPAVGSDHLPVWAYVSLRPLAVYRKRKLPRTSRFAATGLHLSGELFAYLGGEQGRTRDLSR